MKKVERLSSLCLRACQVARKSGMNHRHGAIVVHNGEVVAEGFNYESPEFKETFSVHAEMDVLSKIKHLGKHFLSQCDMIVVRIGPATLEHTTKLSMPCPMCRPKIEQLGIRRVYYTTNEDFDRTVLEQFAYESRGAKILQYRNAAVQRSSRYRVYREEDPDYATLLRRQQA
jgi:tRNA(Arg) A34 adenosine deaminase TadA